MQGLAAIFPHLIAIASVWLMILVVLYAMRKFMSSKSIKEGVTIKTEDTLSLIRVARFIVTMIALLMTASVFLFLYNPIERTYSEMDKITEAEPDIEYVEATKEQIKKQNEAGIAIKLKKNKEAVEVDIVRAREAFKKLIESTKN